jgi:hypothetical protein
MEKVFPVHARTHHQCCLVHCWVLVQSGQQRATSTSLGKKKTCLNFLALPTEGKDIVYRFIIEYNSLRNFAP